MWICSVFLIQLIILARFQEPVVCLSFFENNENISLQ